MNWSRSRLMFAPRYVGRHPPNQRWNVMSSAGIVEGQLGPWVLKPHRGDKMNSECLR
jgi:hypothetical protein